MWRQPAVCDIVLATEQVFLWWRSTYSNCFYIPMDLYL